MFLDEVTRLQTLGGGAFSPTLLLMVMSVYFRGNFSFSFFSRFSDIFNTRIDQILHFFDHFVGHFVHWVKFRVILP